MEWNDGRAFQEEVRTRSHRVLTTTSGNIQSSASSSKHCTNRHLRTSSHGLRRSTYQPAILKSTVPSNDRQSQHRQKLNARRLKRRIRLAEKYLQHPKFTDYRARARKEVDKNGEIIWSPETEVAFQNALINISAMGRRKKSQHGKTFGRNELIMEWIKQETGKTRTRKQVSSHMQTLDKMFAPRPLEGIVGIPEWRIITKGTDQSISDFDEPEFYENSIADMVRNWRMLQGVLSDIDTDHIPATHSIMPQTASPWALTVSKVDFEMWVSLPDKMDKALHRYTRIQSQLATAITDPLDSIPKWRSDWPPLVSLVEHSPSHDTFDIIYLEASFELMLDFPPPKSKLASSLELDFTSAHSDGVPTNSGCWKCTTHVYQRGKLEAKFEHDECHVSAPGRVKPPFESKWWAEQLTRLTEKRRKAVDSSNDAAISAADEAARNYLKNLKIMQQISIESSSIQQPGSVTRRRVAVLLWSFSQVLADYVGTTTWRKLVSPTSDIVGHYPLPPVEESMLLSSTIDDRMHPSFEMNGFGHGAGFVYSAFHPHDEVYMAASDEELCQDGFMMMSQKNTLSSVTTTYDVATYLDHNHQVFHSNMFDADPHSIYHGDSFVKDAQQGFMETLSNSLEVQHHADGQHILSHHNYTHHVDAVHDSDFHDRSQALLSFDLNTHKLLQAQLKSDHTAHCEPISQSEPPTEHSSTIDHQPLSMSHPTSHPSAANLGTETSTQMQPTDTGQHHLAACDVETTERKDVVDDEVPQGVVKHCPSKDLEHQASHSPGCEQAHAAASASRTMRPSLHHYHTFSGVLPAELTVNTNNVFEGLGVRHDFNLLLDNLTGSHNDDFFEQNHDSLLESLASTFGGDGNESLAGVIGLGIIRPRSQPLPLSLTTLESQHSPMEEEAFDRNVELNSLSVIDVVDGIDGEEQHTGGKVEGSKSTTSEELLKAASPKHHRRCQKLIQSSFTDSDLGSRFVSGSDNGFVWAAYHAYSDHHHLTIRPDDIWFAILTQLSFFINANAEELRAFFVEHQGQKELEVLSDVANFGAMAVQMTKIIAKNVIDPDLREWVMPSFSTTTNHDKVVGAILFMGAMQKYFSYQMSVSCGIPSVTLLGDVEDWKEILRRLDKIDLLGEEPQQFARMLRPVLRHMILTFEDPTSIEVKGFWNTIVHRHSMGSGTDYLSGWLTAFCFWSETGDAKVPRSDNTQFLDVEYPTVDVDSIPAGIAAVPVSVDDMGHQYESTMIAGSVGIAALESHFVQPVSGWWMYQNEAPEQAAQREVEKKRLQDEINSWENRTDSTFDSERWNEFMAKVVRLEDLEAY